ncbi:hypothetical protein J437_LFUL008723 [Ladona fulva]|uniref:Uncharacterized protein n=1 Tax=Ladona fulva TaxID=123851 RepID=A0A8K0P0S1_LADFU|nr:hypothetical protein J437_LFUL008723 [Ladona fulva]
MFLVFLGNHKAENYYEMVEIGEKLLHILVAHLDTFKENKGTYSEKQSKPFHQYIQNFGRRYQAQYNKNMMENYI